ncbi:RNA polymerase sigma factor, sigma-70 family [Proteiniphilum saccharofermentans]|uniref:RNA polymerase sigma factor, sigma-70 family n=1 Tax=Proteiniphilum saccharofermentans TaxID=1642647 RepID=A0A1R3T7G2_9BACT|nr:sigma-70 family RNA polymerase sigma factor [Proteiniphilum saccharofermentans]SCD19885.1 RNA polymerase sigma factor, sigma-70 family [Proteiniphilum saccharofermentans]
MEIDLRRMEKKKTVKVRFNQNTVFDENEDLLAFMYRAYADKLYAYGLSLHSDTGLIEDAIHDVFIDVYTNEKRLANISNLQQYLIAVLRHRILFLLRTNKRYVEILNDVSDSFIEKNSQELWIENEEKTHNKRLVKRLLSSLTRHQREALHLRFIEGLSYDEISEIMQINYQSVKMLVHRAVSKIRKKDVSSSSSAD